MLSIHFARLIENHSESLAEGLVRRIQSSERTSAYRNIPTETLKRQVQEVYENLSVWLTSKTEAEIEARYSEVGRMRARGGVPVAQTYTTHHGTASRQSAITCGRRCEPTYRRPCSSSSCRRCQPG